MSNWRKSDSMRALGQKLVATENAVRIDRTFGKPFYAGIGCSTRLLQAVVRGKRNGSRILSAKIVRVEVREL